MIAFNSATTAHLRVFAVALLSVFQGPLELRPQLALEGARNGYGDPVFAILEF
jgi:hypothetical protein